MQELKIEWGHVVRVWWLIMWRGALGGLLIGAALGFVIGIIGYALGWSPMLITTLSAIVGWVIGLVWFVVVVRMALSKNYSDFRLALVPRAAT